MFKWVWRGLLGCLALSVGWSIYLFVIRPGEPFNWDEAGHSLKGLLIAHDVRTGDWLSLLYDTYKQVYWPPLHSWLTGAVFLVWEPATVVARVANLSFFILTALVIYVSALQFGQAHREVAATIATSLFLTAPPLIFASARAMVEAVGLCFVSLTVLIYIWLNSRPRSARAHVWLGIAILLAYFTKTNYGILLFLVWITATWFGGGTRALLSRQSLYVVLPMAVAFAIWFGYPPKIRSTLQALINIPWGEVDPYSLQGFLFFPKAVLHFFGSIWQSLIPAVALFVAFKFWRNPGIRLLLLLALVQFGLALGHHTRDERHILPMFPAVVLITGFVFAQYWSVEGKPLLRWMTRLAAVALCVGNVVTLPAFLRPLSSPPTQPMVADKIAAAVKDYRSSLVLGTTEIRYPSPPVLDWQLLTDKNLLPVTHAGVTMNFEEDRKIGNFVGDSSLPSGVKRSLKRVTSRGELPAKTRSIYLGLVQEYSYAGNLEKVQALLRRMDSSDPFEVIAVLTKADPDSVYPFEFVDEAVRPLGFEHISTEAFAGTKVRLDLYRRSGLGGSSQP